MRQDYPTPAPVKSFLDSGPLMFMPGVGTAAIAGETGLDMAENGLNWANGLQAGLSLLPIAGPVAKSLSTATKDFAKGFNEYRLSRAMNDAVTDFKGSPSVIPERRIQSSPIDFNKKILYGFQKPSPSLYPSNISSDTYRRGIYSSTAWKGLDAP